MTLSNEQKAMKWVKASERLPTKFKMYICKYLVKDEHGLMFKPVRYVQFDTVKNEWTKPPGEIVEWLDESAQLKNPSNPYSNPKDLTPKRITSSLKNLTHDTI